MANFKSVLSRTWDFIGGMSDTVDRSTEPTWKRALFGTILICGAISLIIAAICLFGWLGQTFGPIVALCIAIPSIIFGAMFCMIKFG